jgi:hypothetical protein
MRYQAPVRYLALAIVLAGCGPAKWRATPQQMSPLDPLPVLPTKVGPLSVHEAPPATAWNDVQTSRRLTEDRYLDAPRIQAEVAAYHAVLETFFQPLTPETKIGFDQVRRSGETLHRLAPYSMWNVSLAYQQASERLNVCIMYAGLMGSCFRDWANVPRPNPPVPYDFRWAESGIAVLTVHDLMDDARWKGFAADARRALAGAKGLMIDMRNAAGSDPRGMLSWVAKLAGKEQLRPLRAIERPAAADTYAAAYEAKYLDRGRDPALWRTLVGDTEETKKSVPTALPITIIVGRYCHSACEVIVRSLATYAKATVLGGVGKTGRAARDEPALLYLPHSQSTVYFHATRYLFDAEIEAATGPSEEWEMLTGGDGVLDNPNTPSTPTRFPGVDLFAFATRDLEYRIAHPQGWPRCDAPVTAAKPVQGVERIGNRAVCPGRTRVIVKAAAPWSVMRRFFATCAPPIQASSYLPGEYYLRADVTPAVVQAIAGSELVERIDVDCEPEYHLN